MNRVAVHFVMLEHLLPSHAIVQRHHCVGFKTLALRYVPAIYARLDGFLGMDLVVVTHVHVEHMLELKHQRVLHALLVHILQMHRQPTARNVGMERFLQQLHHPAPRAGVERFLQQLHHPAPRAKPEHILHLGHLFA